MFTQDAATRTVSDPFRGVGTMFALANQHGLDAVDAELPAKHAEKARTLEPPH